MKKKKLCIYCQEKPVTSLYSSRIEVDYKKGEGMCKDCAKKELNLAHEEVMLKVKSRELEIHEKVKAELIAEGTQEAIQPYINRFSKRLVKTYRTKHKKNHDS